MVFVEAPFYHLQCSHFFRYEQNGFTAAEKLRNDVGDGLGFAGSGRSLDHQISPGPCFQNCQGLTAVCIPDEANLTWCDNIIKVNAFCNGRSFINETIAEQSSQYRMLVRLLVIRPGRWVKIIEHQELAKREEA